MKTSTKRAASAGASIAAVGAIVLGSFAAASSFTPAPEPTPTSVAVPAMTYDLTELAPTNGLAAEQEAEAAAVEAARIAEEARIAAELAAAEAARIEAERVAAEQAAAEVQRQAEIEAANRNAQRSAPRESSGGGESAPEPIRCPSGTIAFTVDGNGNESNCQAQNGGGEVCGEYNVANECVSWFRP